MKLRINQALLLCNLRQRKSNKEAGRIAHQGLKTKKDLAKLIWPKSQDPEVYMSYLVSGTRKTIPRESIEIICHELVVDPNFLFGFPSEKHDDEFIILIQEK